MVKFLMPYGSARYLGLVSKVGTAKFAKADLATLLPYGSAQYACLVAKVGITKVDNKKPFSETSARKVVRLNARTS